MLCLVFIYVSLTVVCQTFKVSAILIKSPRLNKNVGKIIASRQTGVS